MCRPTKRPKPQVAIAAPLGATATNEAAVDFGPGLETFVFDLKNDTDFLAINNEWAQEAPIDALLPEEVTSKLQVSAAPSSVVIANEDDASKPKTFVYTAFEMVSDVKNAAAIGFSEDGNIIEIRDLELLCEKILPVYFRHKNVTSFYRQLNSYGFRTTRSSATNVVHAFVHELFRAGHEEFLGNILRKKCLKKQARLAAKKDQVDYSLEGTSLSPPSPLSVSSGGSDEARSEDVFPEKKKLVRDAPIQIDALREEAVKAAQHTVALEMLNRKLQNENQAILNESEGIFSSVNQMADAQTSLIARLFGREAGLAFAEQCKPFRMGGEAEAGNVSISVEEQARDFESFNDQTAAMLFEDDDLALLENIFTTEA